jgi:hypothetical protein
VTPLRTKLVPILAAIALVGLAAAGLRLSEPAEEKNFEVINGVVGHPVKINNGEVTVTQVRVGTALKRFGEIQDRTDGMFVAVSVTGAATGPKQLELQAARLLSGAVRYEGYQLGAGFSANPGFQTSIESVFRRRSVSSRGDLPDLVGDLCRHALHSALQHASAWCQR